MQVFPTTPGVDVSIDDDVVVIEQERFGGCKSDTVCIPISLFDVFVNAARRLMETNGGE